MDVYNADVKNGTNVQVHYFNGSAAQQWYVVNLGGGEYRIMSNLNRSYSLDVYGWNDANETNVQIWQTTNDKFKLKRDGSSYTTGRHIIIPSFSDNHVLDVNRGSDPAKYDINVQLWHLANNNTNQYWAFEKAELNKPYNANYPYWGKGSRTGTEAENWYYNLLKTYSYVIRNEVVYTFNYSQLDSFQIKLDLLRDKSYSSQGRKNLLNDTIELAHEVVAQLPIIGHVVDVIDWVETVNNVNSSSLENDLKQITAGITAVKTDSSTSFTVSVLKKDMNGGYEVKILSSKGTRRIYDITKSTYETLTAYAITCSNSKTAYKVAPQYTYFQERWFV